MPIDLELGLICERTNWRILPHELLDINLDEIRTPLYLVYVYHLFERYAKNMKDITGSDMDIVAMVEKMRSMNSE